MHLRQVLFLWVLVCSTHAFAAVPQSQRDALIAFYDSTNGDAWTNHTGWKGAAGTECTWFGVTCDAARTNVTSLVLIANNVGGPIPSQIGDLSTLQTLNLTGNPLTGSLPREIGNLRALRTLVINVNVAAGGNVTGSFPPLNQLTSLTSLTINSTSIADPIPPELGGLTSLTVLELLNNRLTGAIPPQLGALSALTRLDLSGNQLTGQMPASLSALSSLTTLSLARNRLSGALADLPRPAGLQIFNAGTNQLTGSIPADLGSLKQLTNFDVNNNQLTGSIPPSVGQLTQLQFFNVSTNQLSGAIPTEIGSLTKLVNLTLDRNALSGPIPDSIRNLQALQQFTAASNRVSGPIPAAIGDLANLRQLILDGNALSGPLPSSITRLTNLQRLSIESNALTGGLPADIGSLRALTFLSLRANFLDGPIPTSIGDLTNLSTTLSLANNSFTGTLPDSIGNLQQLVVFSVADNELEGPLPVSLSNLKKLQSLLLSGNHFSGMIPKQYGSLTSLTTLFLARNALRGAVPTELLNLTALRDGFSDFAYNALFATDPALNAFLNRKQAGNNFTTTQTVAPTNVKVVSVTDRSAIVSWTPIAFTQLFGGYQVVASTSPGGPPAALVTTSFKTSDSTVIRGLKPSTQYFFTVSTLTFPFAGVKNLLNSDASPAVTGTTTAAVLSPPDISVVAAPRGLVQVDGVAVNQDSITYTNNGDTAGSLTFITTAPFTVTPSSVTIAPGETVSVAVTATLQPPGSYYRPIGATGPSANLTVTGSLLSVKSATGAAVAVPVFTRLELAGASGSEDVGNIAFRNTGSAPLLGTLVSDQPWIAPPNTLIQIAPGQSASFNFRVLRSQKPLDIGSSIGTLSLVYVAATGASAGTVRAFDTTPSPVNVSKVTVVDTTKPTTTSGSTPALAAGEIGLFAPGLATLVRNGLSLTSDLTVTNASTAKSLSDLRVVLTVAGSTGAQISTFNPIAASQGVSVVNILQSLYSKTNSVGTVQLRSSNVAEVTAVAKVVGTTLATATLGDAPVFRSDRSDDTSKNDGTTVLTGLREGADVFIQETSGTTAAVTIRYYDAQGEQRGTTTQMVAPLSLATLNASVPAGAVTAVITNTSTARVSAYARNVDASGDTWSIVDWRRVNAFDSTTPVRVAFAEGGSSSTTGRRRVVAHAGGAQTDVTIFNPASDDAVLRVEVFDTTGHSASPRQLTIGAKQTMTLANAAAGLSSGQVVITPLRGEFYASARDYRAQASGSMGSSIPLLPSTSGLRIGQSRIFSGLSDPTSATIDAAVPGTTRSSLGLAETAGQGVTVRVKLAITENLTLASPLISRTYQLGPYQQLVFERILREIGGASRDTAFGDLQALKVVVDVIDGKGAVVPFVITTDNGSGDTYVRVD